ncbi:MAG: DnaD domain protein [Anaerolineales bacterium]|nr:DnaD domain protein [Anaerolineales bacterium]
MQGFPGFPEGKLRTVPVPEPFFTELLPAIDHLGELKVTLYAFWRLSLMEGKYRFLRRDDLARDEIFMRGLSTSPRLAQEILDDALERAEARGTLLYVSIEDAAARHDLYFVNSPRGREAVEKLIAGEWRPDESATGAVTLSHVRSNIFVLYEQNIGPLTPLIADELRDLMATYPGPWIEDAIRIAARNNIRKLKYIIAVLDRMKAEGRAEQPQADAGQDLSRYDGYLVNDAD